MRRIVRAVGVAPSKVTANAMALAMHGIGDAWHWQNTDSYTVPNAHCPRCPKRVFFYRSPYGGCVYFDDLGPPSICE